MACSRAHRHASLAGPQFWRGRVVWGREAALAGGGELLDELAKVFLALVKAIHVLRREDVCVGMIQQVEGLRGDTPHSSAPCCGSSRPKDRSGYRTGVPAPPWRPLPRGWR